jgi:hypothetical protein
MSPIIRFETKRPGLARHIAHRADANARFLEDLAPRRILDRFARLDEARECGIHSRLPRLLPAEQDVALVAHHHDHHRIGAREMVHAAGGAMPAVSGVHHFVRGRSSSRSSRRSCHWMRERACARIPSCGRQRLLHGQASEVAEALSAPPCRRTRVSPPASIPRNTVRSGDRCRYRSGSWPRASPSLPQCE